jgi:hypothetical protein
VAQRVVLLNHGENWSLPDPSNRTGESGARHLGEPVQFGLPPATGSGNGSVDERGRRA